MDIQIHFNKEKIYKVWADKQVLNAVAARIKKENFLVGGGALPWKPKWF